MVPITGMAMLFLFAPHLSFAQQADSDDALIDPQIAKALASGLRPTYVDTAKPIATALEARMRELSVPGVAIAVLRKGEVVHAAGYGLRASGETDKVNADTLFNVGSISKVVTAALTLQLVAENRLTLDGDVNAYLKSWQLPMQLPDGKAVRTPVTLRMLLSHTAGTGVHGFADFEPDEKLPTLQQTLDGTGPAKNPPVRLQHAPGQTSDYSGGGTTIVQQVLEDVSGQSIESLARQKLFTPLHMTRSTFADPLSLAHAPSQTGNQAPARNQSPAQNNVAKAHDEHGKPATGAPGWQRFPQASAAGLWTSAREMGAFVGALLHDYQGNFAPGVQHANGNQSSNRKPRLLPASLALDMMSEVATSWHGIGPRLDGDGLQRIFHHGGSNSSYHAWIEGYLATGDGMVILTNGENGALLRTEIRNALSDAIGLGVNAPVRTLKAKLDPAQLAELAGRYHADPGCPAALRRGLNDLFDFDHIDVLHGDGQLRVRTPEETGVLQVLAPNRFVAPSIYGTRYRFHRDAFNKISSLTVELGDSRSCFVRR